jgi:hypothetical protein
MLASSDDDDKKSGEVKADNVAALEFDQRNADLAMYKNVFKSINKINNS